MVSGKEMVMPYPNASNTIIRITLPVKRRLLALQQEAVSRLDRHVTLAEIVEVLVDEHDRNAREEAGA